MEGLLGAWLLGSGRLGRVAYAIRLGVLLALLAGVVFTFFLLVYATRRPADTMIEVWFYLCLLAALWAYFTLLIRRLHDFRQTGWHAAWIGCADIVGVLDRMGMWTWLALAINAAVLLWPSDTGPGDRAATG